MGHLSEGVTLSGTGRGQERHLDKVIGSWEIKKDMEDKVKQGRGDLVTVRGEEAPEWDIQAQ